MSKTLDIITIGEGLIELSCDKSLTFAENLKKYYGGDTLTCAIAALRLGSKVGYITRVGNDSFKEYLLDSWHTEGLDISQVKLTNDKNGLYLIARPNYGAKEIVYYRKKTAATKLSIDDISADYIKSAKYIYSSGIAQSLSLSSREAIKKAFEIASENSVAVAYDPNFHPQLTTLDEAKEALTDVLPYVNIMFLSLKKDGETLLELDSHEKIIKYLWDSGVSTVVVKSADDGGYYTGCNGDVVFCPFYSKENILDTTCSSDAFNGGFLHALNSGLNSTEATKLASIVASLQAKGLGAIKSVPNRQDVYLNFKGNDNV